MGFRLLTFCTVPHAAQFAPTICANLRWQSLQLLMVGPDAISLMVSGGMSTISKRLEAVSFWRKTVSNKERLLLHRGEIPAYCCKKSTSSSGRKQALNL